MAARKAMEENINSDSEESLIDWMEIASILWQARKSILFITFSSTIIAGLLSFFVMTEYFKSTAVLLPETEKSKLASLGSLSDLASLAGVSVGGDGSLAKLYPTIIKSENVLKKIIYKKYTTKNFQDSVNLIQYWEIKDKSPERDYEVALKNLQENLQVSMENKTGVVSISFETPEPQLSADIVNSITKELDTFIRTKRTTNAGEQRKWIEARLAEVKEDLERSENRLKSFREKNRIVSGSPQLLLEQERLLRDIQINSTMFIELKKQHEIAKIEEIKNIPIINIMDAARPAAKRERPKRSVIIIVTFIIALIIISGIHIMLKMNKGKIKNLFRQLKMNQGK